MEQHPEKWLPVPGYEDAYEVSDLGNIRSLDRTVTDLGGARTRRFRGRLLRPQPNAQSARRVITLHRPGDARQEYVYRLVLLAFVGPPAPGQEACHNNGDPTDDRLSNLRWDTRRENTLDRVRHGTHHKVNRTHCPQGHPLAAPNLTRTRRACLACARARSYIQKHGGDLQEISDRYHAAILQDAPAR